MIRIGCSLVAVGFLGGVLCRDKYALKKNEVSAAGFDLPPLGNIAATEVDETSHHVAQTRRFSFPLLQSVWSKKSYVSSYDHRNKVPSLVYEYLTSSHIARNELLNKKHAFIEDSNLKPTFRSTNADYKDSGYDRGHLAAASNHSSSQEFYDDTFVLSNVAPQVPDFNNGAWKRLEDHVKKLLKLYKDVHVYTGTLFLPHEKNGKKYVTYELIGINEVAVPTHFFKVIVGETEKEDFDMEIYLMKNVSPDSKVYCLEEYFVSKDYIEKVSGLEFFKELPETALRKINGKSLRRAGSRSTRSHGQ